MIASASYQDFCDLTDRGSDRDVEADVRVRAWLEGSDVTFSQGGGEMQTEQLVGGDGDDFDSGVDPLIEEVEDQLSCLDEVDRVMVAGNALASVSDEHATVAVLEWLCKVGGEARAVVAKEAIGLLANQVAAGGEDVGEAYSGLCAVLSRVGDTSAVMLPAEAE